MNRLHRSPAARDYIEEMVIDNHACKIEDQHETRIGFPAGHPNRYKPWVGGCAIGPGDATIAETRGHIYAYMDARLEREMGELADAIARKQVARNKIKANGVRSRKLRGEW